MVTFVFEAEDIRTNGWRAIYRELTKACLQSPAGKEKRDQTKESSKAGIGLFVASCDASECLEMAEEVFDQMAPFVHFCIVRDAVYTENPIRVDDVTESPKLAG